MKMGLPEIVESSEINEDKNQEIGRDLEWERMLTDEKQAKTPFDDDVDEPIPVEKQATKWSTF